MINKKTNKKVAPYGSWQSPINPEQLSASSPAYAFPCRDGDNLYWLESRPWENGRAVVVKRNTQGAISDALPAPLNARSKVHEYGGTPYIVIDDRLYFCLYDDQRIYCLDLTSKNAIPTPITTENNYRYADFCYDPHRERLICVAENHGDLPEPENSIVAIPLDNFQGNTITLDNPMTITTLCSGDDFYAYPRLDNTGEQLSWISWNHPNMPWDSTTLWLATLNEDGTPIETNPVAGNGHEAIFQPQWSPDNQLYFVSDRDNWWNIYRLKPATTIEPAPPATLEQTIEPIHTMAAEFATPLWVLGMSTYGFCHHNDLTTLVCCYSKNGNWHLAQKRLHKQPSQLSGEIESQPMETIATDYTQLSDIYCSGNQAWMVGAAPKINSELVEYCVENKRLTPVTPKNPLPFGCDYLSEPTPLSFTTADATQENQSHGFFYPPQNPEYSGEYDSLPPLIVVCHGGPTGATSTALNLKVQYWTSRGFAVLDVNYRGSTGYGRHYREQLHGRWGLADVDDVVTGAQHLVKQRLVDPDKIAIRGSSAGGYTVLAALCFYDLFKAGACLYGIGDLETLAKDTHKFESRYLDTLIGPYPEERSTYQQRSPIHHIDKLHCPVIFFQGLDDNVVPPQQALSMTQALRDKHLPVAYLPFEGEAHGFRKAETVKRALEAELYFYGKIFDFPTDKSLPVIHIDNLPSHDKTS
jgi:dipeptidyl aminopeptidase/acylaminoacyl peptidase